MFTDAYCYQIFSDSDAFFFYQTDADKAWELAESAVSFYIMCENEETLFSSEVCAWLGECD